MTEENASDPLRSLLVEAAAIDRERIAACLAGRLALDKNSGRTVLLPGYSALDAKAKLLALLLLRRAAVLLGLSEEDAVSPSVAAREAGMPGGTVRRMLPELVDSNQATKATSGGYRLSDAQVSGAIALVERPDAVLRSPKNSARKRNGGAGHERTKRSAPSAAAPTRSPSALVARLVDAGFFRTPRTLADVQRQLKDKSGHEIPTTSLSPVMTRLLRAGRLDRVRGADGVYEYSVYSGAR